MLVAAIVGLAIQSPLAWLASHQGINVLLAVLVFATALTIEPAALRRLGEAWRPVVVAVATGIIVLPALSWLASRIVAAGSLRDGIMVAGLAPCEIASVATTAMASGEALLSAGVLIGSTVATVALAGPILSLEAGHASIHPASILVNLAFVTTSKPSANATAGRSRRSPTTWAVSPATSCLKRPSRPWSAASMGNAAGASTLTSSICSPCSSMFRSLTSSCRPRAASAPTSPIPGLALNPVRSRSRSGAPARPPRRAAGRDRHQEPRGGRPGHGGRPRPQDRDRGLARPLPRRKRRLRQLERQYGDRLDEVADFLSEFASQIKAVGPKTYLESMAYNDRDAKRDKHKELDRLSPDRRS